MITTLVIFLGKGAVSRMARIDYNEGAMAWAENSLRYARGRDLSRLVRLLVAVRDEIALEMKLAKSAPLTRREAGAR